MHQIPVRPKLIGSGRAEAKSKEVRGAANYITFRSDFEYIKQHTTRSTENVMITARERQSILISNTPEAEMKAEPSQCQT